MQEWLRRGSNPQRLRHRVASKFRFGALQRPRRMMNLATNDLAAAIARVKGSTARSGNTRASHAVAKKPLRLGDTGPSAIQMALRDASARSGNESSVPLLRSSFLLENMASETTRARWQPLASYQRPD